MGKMSMGAMSVSGETRLAFSDANYKPEPGQEKGAKILKMQGKPGIKLKNLWVVPGCMFFSLFTGADVLQSMVYILENENYYNYTSKEAAAIAADSVTYAGIVSIPLVLVAGFFYDIFGRGITTVSTLVIGAIATFFTPIVAGPLGIVGYDICRVIFASTLIILLSNPFINDYVQVECRGAATGF